MIEFFPCSTLPKTFFEENNNLFYSKRWLDVLQSSYNFEWMFAEDDVSNTYFLFAYIDNLSGKKIISLPFSDYTPINGENSEKVVNVIRKAIERFPEYRFVIKTSVSQYDPFFSSFKAERHAYYHSISLEEPEGKKLSSSFKRGVKKALKSEVSTEISYDIDALHTFYKMYHTLRLNKFKSIPQPFSFFSAIHKSFIDPKQGFVLQAKFQDSVIASIIVLKHKQTLYYKFGSSDQNFLDKRPNNLLFSELIKIAREMKCTSIDLGLSGSSLAYEGLVRFKESMGGKRFPITYFSYAPKEYKPDLENETRTMATSIVKTIVDHSLDMKTTSELSSTIYPYFA